MEFLWSLVGGGAAIAMAHVAPSLGVIKLYHYIVLLVHILCKHTCYNRSRR